MKPRRKYLKWIAGSLAALSVTGLFYKNRKPKTVKMLTTDGKLVEIPSDKLPKQMKKASKKEIQTWVWKHNT